MMVPTGKLHLYQIRESSVCMPIPILTPQLAP